MSNTREHTTSCITCSEPFYYESFETDLGTFINIPYCPNRACSRYGLFTAEVSAAVVDSDIRITVKGGTLERAVAESIKKKGSV